MAEEQELARIELVDIEREMREAYLDYAMSVITSRALPDVRDGLKPVQRRILYTMYDNGLRPDRPYRKSATTVGDVLGKYHPHGDSAVYDAMVRLAQPFSLRYPLVDGQGNFGSIDGDPAAAYRYTEARPASLAMEMLADIDKDTVDFGPNFDDSRSEPKVLPARVPNLLVNGASGIAVGMATNIPPHNLGEVCDVLIHMIDRYNDIDSITPEEIMGIMPGPDFPTGGMILGTDGILNAYATGRGRLIMRATAHFEEVQSGRTAIIITEIPYQLNKTTLVERIAELARHKRVEAIADLRDESDRDGMRIVIELKRGSAAPVVLNQLYKFSYLQMTFGVNVLALVDGQPRVLPIKRMFTYYIEHRREVVRRRTEFELEKARHRQHVLEGLRIALENLDAVIETIRRSSDASAARDALMARFGLSEIQSQAILDMQLRRLAALERQKIEDEYAEVTARIAFLEDLLGDALKILAVIREDLVDLKEKFGDGRRTVIIEGEFASLSDEDLVEQEDVLITLTERGYIKRVPVDTYRAQGRGGRGIIGAKTKGEDTLLDNFVASTRDRLLIFTDRGRVFQLPTYQIPDSSREAAGTPLANLIQIEGGERVTVALPVPAWQFERGRYLVMATRLGRMKRIALAAFDGVRPSGLIAIGLDEGDELRWAKVTNGDDEIIMVTRRAMALRFKESDVRPMGRAASGVMAIRLRKGDTVAGMDLVVPGADLFVITRRGHGKRTPLSEYGRRRRYTMGVLTLDARRLDELGEVADARVVEDGNEIAVITDQGITMKTKTDLISRMGRITRGVKVMNLDAGQSVASFAYLKDRAAPEGEPGEEGAPVLPQGEGVEEAGDGTVAAPYDDWDTTLADPDDDSWDSPPDTESEDDWDADEEDDADAEESDT
jgi:DNA gyrase subunit A